MADNSWGGGFIAWFLIILFGIELLDELGISTFGTRAAVVIIAFFVLLVMWSDGN